MMYPKQLRSQFSRLKNALNDADELIVNHRIIPHHKVPDFKANVEKAQKILKRLTMDKYMSKYDDDCKRYIQQCKAIVSEFAYDLTLDWNQYDPETEDFNAVHGVSANAKPSSDGPEACLVTPKVFDDVLTGRRAYKEELEKEAERKGSAIDADDQV